MDNTKDTKDAPKAPTAADTAKDAGRTLQAMEAAKTPAEHDRASRTEDAPKAHPGTPAKPVADANPDEVLGMGDSWPNMISSAGLNPIQRARVEGAPLDGALGGTVLGPFAVRTPSREERLATRQTAATEKASKSKDKDNE